jgi:hypothetical protein
VRFRAAARSLGDFFVLVEHVPSQPLFGEVLLGNRRAEMRASIERLPQSVKNPLGGIGAIVATVRDAVNLKSQDGWRSGGRRECRRTPKEPYLYNLDNPHDTNSPSRRPLSQGSTQRDWSGGRSGRLCPRGARLRHVVDAPTPSVGAAPGPWPCRRGWPAATAADRRPIWRRGVGRRSPPGGVGKAGDHQNAASVESAGTAPGT